MSLYSDLSEVLTPYANKIKELNGSLDDLSYDVDVAAGFNKVSTGESYFKYLHHNAKNVKVEAESPCAITIHGVTVADIDHIDRLTYPQYVEEVETDDIGHTYRITALADNSNNYNMIGKLSGFTTGKKYRICLKVTDPQNTGIGGGGHYCSVMIGSTSITSRDQPYSEERITTATFTYNGSNGLADIYINPFRSGGTTYERAVGDTFRIDDIYVNEIDDDNDIFTHEAVFSYTETNSVIKKNINGEMFIVNAVGNVDTYISGTVSKLMTINDTEPDEGGNITVKSHLQGKKAVVFGDSVMGKGVSDYKDCPYVMGKITGLEVINVAMGGTAVHIRNDTQWDAIGLLQLTEQIVSGDWSRLIAAKNYNFEGKASANRVYPILTALDWSTVDFVIINYAGNDISTADATSIIDDATNPYNTLTYLGAFRTAIETLLREYPHLQVLVTTGVWRWWKINNEIITSEERVMANNHYYYEWGDALMECAQNEYHFPVFDFYRNLGANKLNYLEYSTDGAHPEEEYLERMGSKLAAAMMSKF